MSKRKGVAEIMRVLATLLAMIPIAMGALNFAIAFNNYHAGVESYLVAINVGCGIFCTIIGIITLIRAMFD